MAAYVSADAVVPCRADRALRRLETALGASGETADPGRISVTVGPGARILRKRVRVRLGPPRRLRRSAVASLWWIPTGRWARLYPLLRAGVAVTPIDDTSSLLSVEGEYVPPLGRAGAAIDHAGMHRVALATVRKFTKRLAHELSKDVKEAVR